MSFFNLIIYGPQNKLKEYKNETAAISSNSIEEYNEIKKKKMVNGNKLCFPFLLRPI